MRWLTEPLRRLEAHLDAWAARKLPPDVYAEALELDRRMRRRPWRWLALFVLVAGLASLLVRAIWPSVEAGESLAIACAGFVWLAALVGAPWYGYRKYASQPWKRFTMLVVLAVFGAAVGFSVALMQSNAPIATMLRPEKVTRAIGVSLALGLFIACVVLGISRLRLREAEQRSARLAAEAESERLERRTLEADLKLLQAQVEPHFLFNTLSNVRHLMATGSPQAVPMLDHLIHYLRTAMPDIRSDSTSLGREAELATAYLEIMRMRMGGELRFSVEIAEGLAANRFPPLILMTLVENAVKHGVVPRAGGEIRIGARREGDRLVVEVVDDGKGFTGPLGHGTGLANVRDRLKALHGDAARLVLESGQRGAVARVEIPA